MSFSKIIFSPAFALSRPFDPFRLVGTAYYSLPWVESSLFQSVLALSNSLDYKTFVFIHTDRLLLQALRLCRVCHAAFKYSQRDFQLLNKFKSQVCYGKYLIVILII